MQTRTLIKTKAIAMTHQENPSLVSFRTFMHSIQETNSVQFNQHKSLLKIINT